jgi:6-phosphogluconate dehydrogenase
MPAYVVSNCHAPIQQRDYFGAHTFRVLPGKENSKFQAGKDIRTYFFIYRLLV